MRKSLIAAVACISVMGSLIAHSAPTPEDPKKQTPGGLYADSTEAFEMKQAEGESVLLVDIVGPHGKGAPSGARVFMLPVRVMKLFFYA